LCALLADKEEDIGRKMETFSTVEANGTFYENKKGNGTITPYP
jgi:hypothetical protein